MAEVLGRIIVIKKNGEDGSILPMLENICIIGRDSDCDIRIKLPTVSSKHCKLEVVNGKVIFTNLSATNPAVVNNVAIEDKTFLNDEDVFTVTTRSFRWETCKSKENDAKVTETGQENRSGKKRTKKRLMKSSSKSSIVLSTPTMAKTPKIILKRTSVRKSSSITKTPASTRKATQTSTFVDQHDNDENVEKIISSPDRKKTAALRSIHAAQLKSKHSPESSKWKKNENSLQLSPSVESPGTSEKQKTPGKTESGDSSFDFSAHKTPSVPTEMFVSPLQTPTSQRRSSTTVPHEQCDNPGKDAAVNGDGGHSCTNLHKDISGTPSRKTSYGTRRRSSPKADYTNVVGVKRLMAKSPVADYSDISGVDVLMASPETHVTSNDDKEEKEHELRKSMKKRKLSSLKSEESLAEEDIEKKDSTFTKRRSTPKADCSNISGVNILMQSPKVVIDLLEEATTPKSAASSKRRSGELNSATAKDERQETPGRKAQVVLARISPQVIEQYSPKSQAERLSLSSPSSGTTMKKKNVLSESTVINRSPLPSDDRESLDSKRNLSLGRCIEKYRSRKSQEIILSPLKMSPRRLVLTNSPSAEKSSRVSTPNTSNRSASLHEQSSKTPEISSPKQRKETPCTERAPDHKKPEPTPKPTPTSVKEAEKTPILTSSEAQKSRKSTPGSGQVLVRTLRSRTVSSVKKRKSFEAKVRRVTAKKVKKIEMEKLSGLQPEEQNANEEAALEVMEQDENAGVKVTDKANVVSTKSAVKARQTRSKILADIDISQLQEKLDVEDAESIVSDRIDDDDNVSEAPSIATTKRKRNVKSKTDAIEASPVKKSVRQTRKVSATPSTVKKNSRGTKLERAERSNEDEQSDTEPVAETVSIRKARLQKGKSRKMSTSPIINVKKSASKAKTVVRRSNSFSPGVRITRSRKQIAANH